MRAPVTGGPGPRAPPPLRAHPTPGHGVRASGAGPLGVRGGEVNVHGRVIRGGGGRCHVGPGRRDDHAVD